MEDKEISKPQPVQDTQEPPSPSPHSSTQSKLLLVMSGVLLLALGVAGGWYYGRISNPIESMPAPSPTVATDQMAGWETYINKEYGFKFKYPPRFTLTKQENQTILLDELTNHSIAVMVLPVTGFEYCFKYSEEKVITIDGENAQTADGIGGTEMCSDQEKDYTNLGTTYVLIPLNKSETTIPNIKIHLDYEYPLTDKEMARSNLDQILSTFEFLDEGTSSNAKTHISNKLGIQFSYLEDQRNSIVGGENEIIKIYETDRKVYVYPSTQKPQEGQWVEVFEKKAEESLEEAIKSQFLKDRSSESCFVTVTDSDKNDIIVTASIDFPQNEGESLEEWWQKTEYCSPDYAKTNGMRYFWYDPRYPTKYLFFSIGQYIINASEGKSWQDTIQIIK